MTLKLRLVRGVCSLEPANDCCCDRNGRVLNDDFVEDAECRVVEPLADARDPDGTRSDRAKKNCVNEFAHPTGCEQARDESAFAGAAFHAAYDRRIESLPGKETDHGREDDAPHRADREFKRFLLGNAVLIGKARQRNDDAVAGDGKDVEGKRCKDGASCGTRAVKFRDDVAHDVCERKEKEGGVGSHEADEDAFGSPDARNDDDHCHQGCQDVVVGIAPVGVDRFAGRASRCGTVFFVCIHVPQRTGTSLLGEN